MKIKAISAALLCMLVLDFIYLSLTKNFYNNLVKSIQGQNIVIKPVPMVLVYLLLAFVYYYFILEKNGTIKDAFILGISIYGTFDLTNYAIFNKWNLKAVLMDTLWGGILFSLTRYLTTL
tara:strand:- start:22 stop:381 length:360 start_codon:yes stop_codon:yes gene_type:complete